MLFQFTVRCPACDNRVVGQAMLREIAQKQAQGHAEGYRVAFDEVHKPRIFTMPKDDLC